MNKQYQELKRTIDIIAAEFKRIRECYKTAYCWQVLEEIKMEKPKRSDR